MYCSHCGKKVTDAMLFCPFCGEEIVIPEQDEDVDAAEPAEPAPQTIEPAPQTTEPAPEPEKAPAEAPKDDAEAELLSWSRDRRSFAADEAPQSAPEAEFSPLDLEQAEAEGTDWRADISRRKREAAPEKKPPQTHRAEGQTARLEGRAPKLEENGVHVSGTLRSANTYVPPKAMDPDDMFMDSKPDAYDAADDYDAYDDVDGDRGRDEGYIYEDEVEGSFLMRHIRGIVGITLFVIMLLLLAIYAFSEAGQRSLAKANLAWNTDVYSAMGYQFYQQAQYDQAGLYYERALSRDPGNYSYASSAAMAYVTGKNTDKAAAMLKKCVEIDPTRVEPYVYLLNLYPEAANRPWDVTQLIQDGYVKTGDSRLAVTG